MSKTPPIRPLYDEFGAISYYQRFGAAYRNPHEPIIARLLAEALRAHPLDTSCVLDLACGSGEVTLAMRCLGAERVVGVDPFTGSAYQARTGQTALPYTFEQIAEGALEGQRFSLIVCSFALHLVDASRLPVLCYQLSRLAPCLVVITPIKRPHIAPQWGWQLQAEMLQERVRLRLYGGSNAGG
jgi:SAM-dependent methyltransferase